MSSTKSDTRHKPYGPYEKFIKRPLDFVCALLAIIVLSPVMLITAVLVRIKLGSPLLFTQDRPGLNEKIFKLYKFRTMTDEKAENGDMLPDDKRSTAFGSFLRRTSLDELPELFNILKGDMSFVGPRPLLPEYLPFYTDTEIHRHDVRPGLTGLAQINGRSFVTWERIFNYDLKYVNNISFVNDLRIIVTTFFKVLKKADIADTKNTENDDSKRKVHKPLNIERQ